MTGPLTLSGNPTAPLQAAAKQYVDSSVAVKADLVSGLVPTSELGSGTAIGAELSAGKWDVGAVRIERERNCDSERAGSGERACEWTGAGVFVDFGAVCADDPERGGGRSGHWPGREPEYRAAGGNSVEREQSERHSLCDTGRITGA